jgi:hypothetical protein
MLLLAALALKFWGVDAKHGFVYITRSHLWVKDLHRYVPSATAWLFEEHVNCNLSKHSDQKFWKYQQTKEDTHTVD